MRGESGVRWIVRVSRTALMAVIVASALLHSQGLSAQVPTSAPRPSSEADALQDYQKRLDDYVALRTRLAKQVRPLSTTSSAFELASRQEALAAAIRQTRKTAKRGDLIPAAVAAQIRAIVQNDFQNRTPDVQRAAFSEVANGTVPVINRTYPTQEAIPTVPPLLLARLPALPDNLQYRFLGRHLVILDGDTRIIIDYVANALPAR